MPSDTETGEPIGAGGRLRLLDVGALTDEQKHLSDLLLATRVSAGIRSGYRAALDDGRLIGPFNALLRAPGIGERQLAWAQAISAADLDPRVREVTVLTVAAAWGADYVLYAHAEAARTAGLDERVIADLVSGTTPVSLGGPARLAHDITSSLVRIHDIPEALYSEFISSFGETAAVTLLALIGQYLATCVVVTCFRVPAPPESRADQH